MKKYTEIYFSSKQIEEDDWANLFLQISIYLGIFRKWNLIIELTDKLHYYIECNHYFPIQFSKLDKFLFKSIESIEKQNFEKSKLYFGKIGDGLIETYEKNKIRKRKILKQVVIHFRNLGNSKMLSTIDLIFEKNKILSKEKMMIGFPASFLKIHFDEQKVFQYQNSTKYLSIRKSLGFLKSDQVNSIFSVNAFPYLNGTYYISPSSYNFGVHSMIVGSSGSGKSKLLGLLVRYISKHPELKSKYKIVMIDPHASIEEDIGGLDSTSVIDFENIETSISLFERMSEDLIASTELLVSLFSSFIPNFNSKLERVLRHSIYLLQKGNCFSFSNFRKLLLDVNYRLNLVKQLENELPNTTTFFFLHDFNELKNQSYNESIAPLISFFDEMELIPTFESTISKNLKSEIQNHFLTIFSLNRMKLGDKSIKTISGFIMQQLLELVQNKEIDEHIIFIIDEVSIVENPILSRILSETRKYGLSLFLAQQYFNQISSSLQNSIFANMINYYVFRVSRSDAEILANHLEIEYSIHNTIEQKIKLLSTLNNQECVLRLQKNGMLYPALKAKTLYLEPVPRIKVFAPLKEKIKANYKIEASFAVDTNISMKDILIELSSSRKKVR